MSGPGGDEAGRTALLTSQVKLLLKTEQRLLRSQRQLETQLRRLEGLNAFALAAPRSFAAGDIVAHALELLWPTCAVQAAVALVRPPPREGPSTLLLRAADRPTAPVRPPPPAGDPAWQAWTEGTLVLEAGQAPGAAGPPLALLDWLAPADGWEQRAPRRRTLVLPLGEGPDSGRHGALLVCRCAEAGRAEATEASDRGFLDLVRSHASAAIEIAALHAEQEERVEARTLDLAVANQQLQVNLDHLRETQARLIEASRLAAIGQLAAAVAHEINNPLSALKSNVVWLAQGPQQEAPRGERAEVLADALAAVRRIATSVARLRELAAAGSLPPGGGAGP